MATRLSDVSVDLVSFVDRAAQRSGSDPTQPQRFLLWKAEGYDPEGSSDMPQDTIDKAELDPAVREALEKAEQEAADATARAEKAETERDEALEKAGKGAGGGEGGGKGDGRESDDDKKVSKEELEKLSPEVRAIVEKSEADREADRAAIQKSEERAQAAEDVAKAERNTRLEGEWIAKAETGELRGLPGEPAQTGPVMKSLAEAAPEAWATFEKDVLGPAVGILRANEVMKRQGVGGEGPPPESAIAKFRGKVADLMKSDSSLKKSEAMERVRKEDPELQQAVAEEMGSAGATA